MLALFLAVVLAQAVQPPPAPAPPALGAAWKKLPLEKGELAHYVRTEADGTQTELIASRQVCDCQPANFVKMLTAAFATVKGVDTTSDTVSICGGSQQRVVATGLATAASGTHNIEVIAFRKEPALVTLEMLFKSAKAPADAESALAALCP